MSPLMSPLARGMSSLAPGCHRNSTGRRRERGFTRVELLVVVVIIAVLGSLIAPAMQTARESARHNMCRYQLHKLGIVTRNFGGFRDSELPDLMWTSSPNTKADD